MAKFKVQAGIGPGSEKEVDAFRFERDGDWIHFYDADGQQVASYIAIAVERVPET